MQKITIGIPFFNAAQFIDRCISSVLNQTFGYWELILVDDGSTDGARDRCLKYVESDKRIHLIVTEHQGVANARNLIIEHATGEFLCFMDVDDWYEPNYLKCLISVATNDHVDLVVCGYIVDWYNKSGKIIKSDDYIQAKQIILSESERSVLVNAFMSGIMCFVWNKLFRIDIIRRYNIRYKNFPVNEDFIFVLDYMCKTQTLTIIPNALYHWVHIDGNFSAVESIPDNLLQIYEYSHSLLAQYLKSTLMADRIFYFTYELIIYKYFKLYRLKRISSTECYSSLAKLHNSKFVKRSFAAYKPTTRIERLFFFLNKNGFYRITYFVKGLITLWK